MNGPEFESRTASVTNGGTAVNVMLSSDSIRPFFQFVTVWVALLAIVTSLAVSALLYAHWVDEDAHKQTAALAAKFQKADMNYGLWVDYTNELKGELIAHGVKVPPNPCTRKGACP